MELKKLKEKINNLTSENEKEILQGLVNALEDLKNGRYVEFSEEERTEEKIAICPKCKQKQEKIWDDCTYTYDDIQKQEKKDDKT